MIAAESRETHRKNILDGCMPSVTQKKYHLKSIVVGWVDETLMQLWCVEDRNGIQLTDYMSHEGAQSELGKILAKDRSKRGDNA